MYVKIKAYGVSRFINSDKTMDIDDLKRALDFEVETDDNGEIKLYSGAEVKEILNPSADVKVNLAESLGVKSTKTKKTTSK